MNYPVHLGFRLIVGLLFYVAFSAAILLAGGPEALEVVVGVGLIILVVMLIAIAYIRWSASDLDVPPPTLREIFGFDTEDLEDEET